MKAGILRVLFVFPAVLVAASFFSSCSVDENAAFFTKASESGNSSTKKKVETVKTGEKKEENTWAEKMKEKEAERKAELEKRKKELAEKRAKDEALKEKKLAADKKLEEKEAARKAIAEKKAAGEEAKEKKLAAQKKQEEKDAKADSARKALADKKEAEEKAKEQKIADARKEAAKKKAEDLAAARKAEKEAASKRRQELAAARTARSSRSSSGGGLGGLFSGMGGNSAKQYKSEGHHVYINQRVLGGLSPSNAKIEIDLSEQRARIYKNDGTGSHLAIETQVSTGKSGHSTSTGTFRIKEKLVEKRSTLYGRWVSGSGQTVSSAGDSRSRPSGGSSFVGASMPYWMRINGGIGMHIGYVPDYPASHGCIRVPSAVQPLIFSKVGVGTSVTIKH